MCGRQALLLLSYIPNVMIPIPFKQILHLHGSYENQIDILKMFWKLRFLACNLGISNIKLDPDICYHSASGYGGTNCNWASL